IFIAVQSFASGLAKRALATDLESDGDGYDLHDVAATPLPTNPFCWTFVSVESKASANSYRSRRGILSVADFVPVASCPLSIFRDGKSTRKTSGLEIVAVESGDLSLLKNSSRSNCHLAAWLRFSRVPFVEVHQATDLRFSSAGRPNFTKLDLAPSASRACPENVPGWVPPRSDILDFSN
ncbi:MAG: metal-dependent hydrolase, partial [Bdellovibrionota bacterium]